MSSIVYPSDTDLLQFARDGAIIIVNPSHVDGRHHRGQYTNAEGDREPFDRTRAEQEKNVKQQRDISDRSSASVIDNHENNNQAAADDERDNTLANGIAP